MTEDRENIEHAFRDHERTLWGLCYRMTGSAADADELVQETFARALARPPADTSRPWKPWLTTVAMNLARDSLRRRKKIVYEGPWLPALVESSRATEPEDDAEARYDRMESVTLAFLTALEALTPKQRAVLILRDVYGASVREAAATLEIGESDVKVSHHRARKALDAYDGVRRVPDADERGRAQRALERLIAALMSSDLESVIETLREDARTITDAGGKYVAARNPVEGADRVARFYLGLMAKNTGYEVRMRFAELNGLPALVVAHEDPAAAEAARLAPRFVLQVDVDDDDRIRDLWVILAPDKLAAVDFG